MFVEDQLDFCGAQDIFNQCAVSCQKGFVGVAVFQPEAVVTVGYLSVGICFAGVGILIGNTVGGGDEFCDKGTVLLSHPLVPLVPSLAYSLFAIPKKSSSKLKKYLNAFSSLPASLRRASSIGVELIALHLAKRKNLKL